MTEEQAKALYPLIVTVRKLFHQLAAAADSLHGGSGITAGMRGVLESLGRHGPQTVPDMARARPVSRQHIQGLVNALAELDLVETLENPAHRRSHLIAMTPAGRAAFDAIRSREAAALAETPLAAAPQELDQANDLLRRLVRTFESQP